MAETNKLKINGGMIKNLEGKKLYLVYKDDELIAVILPYHRYMVEDKTKDDLRVTDVDCNFWQFSPKNEFENREEENPDYLLITMMLVFEETMKKINYNTQEIAEELVKLYLHISALLPPVHKK